MARRVRRDTEDEQIDEVLFMLGYEVKGEVPAGDASVKAGSSA